MFAAFLEAQATAGLRATAEALFPRNDLGAPDFETTDLVPRTLEYLRALPAPQRRLISLLFAFTELGAPILAAVPSRFSRLPAARREALVRGFRRSPWLPLRILGDALKATTTMIYMSHPAALAHVGAYSACARPADSLGLEVRSGALARMSELP